MYGGNVIHRTRNIIFQTYGFLPVTASRSKGNALLVLRSTLVNDNLDIYIRVFEVGQRNNKSRKGAHTHRLVDYKAFYKIIVGGKVTHRNGLIDHKFILLRKRNHHTLNVLVSYIVRRFIYGGRVFVFNRIGYMIDGKFVRFTVNLASYACRIGKFVLAAEF